MTINPGFTASDSQFHIIFCKFKSLTIVILNAITDNAAKIVAEILGSICSIEIFCIKKSV